jgi:hypothetical protein
MTTLHIKSGPRAGQIIEVQGDLTIGRQNSDLTIEDGDLSRHHAMLRHTAEGVEVEDLGSKNGTFVDGHRIDRPTLVGRGAQLALGSTVLEVDAMSEAPVMPTSTLETAGGAMAASPAAGGPATSAASPATPAAGGPATSAASPATPAASPATPPPSPATPAIPATPAASPQTPPLAPLAPLAAANRTPVGVFHPPPHHRAHLATRSILPIMLSLGTAVLTAVALVIYFAAR